MNKINKRKFMKSMVLILCLILFLIIVLTSKILSHTEINYKKISISSGDTLWSIAKDERNNNMYFQDKDIRDIVDEIKYINKLNNSNLSIGNELIIPYYI